LLFIFDDGFILAGAAAPAVLVAVGPRAVGRVDPVALLELPGRRCDPLGGFSTRATGFRK